MYSKTRYQSVDKGPEDDLYEYEPTLLKPERNKGPSRCYNVFMTVVYFALLIMAVVALGTFGAKVAQIVDRVRVVHNSTANSCIIFATYAGTNENGDILLNLHSSGLCGYVFWGLTSVTIVVFVWLVYSIIQAAIGLKVLSPLRILDLVVIILTCFLSLAVSATVDMGLKQTCAALLTGKKATTCLHAYLVEIPEKNQKQLDFYDTIDATRSSSWVMTVALVALSLWYIVMVISYCCVVRHRRRQNRLIQEDECDSLSK